MIRVAACQLNSTADVAANLRAARAAVAEAAAQGCALAVLPECVDYLGPIETRDEELHRDGIDFLGGIRDAVRDHGIWLVAGSMHEPAPTAGKYYNTSYLLDPQGDIVAAYRKLHLFDVDLNDTVAYHESAAIEPGDRVVVATGAGLSVGMGICYDLRFAELFRAQRAQGAQLLALPATFMYETGVAHWEVLLRARAIENQSFVVAADQVGEYMPGCRSFGGSMVVDPWGTVLARVPDVPGRLAVADLDVDALTALRTRMPARPRLTGFRLG